jgi:hypothetical protein
MEKCPWCGGDIENEDHKIYAIMTGFGVHPVVTCENFPDEAVGAYVAETDELIVSLLDVG